MSDSKLRKIGNSVGLIVPAEVLGALNLAEGDSVYISRTETGFSVSIYDPAVTEQVTVLRRVMKKRRSALRELAK